MGGKRRSPDRRALLDAKLTELTLLAKELCPEATVKANTIQWEEEDGHVDVFPPSTVPEDDIDRLITALKNHILLHRENVVITPHIAFDSREALQRILDTTVANIVGFSNGTPSNLVSKTP